MAEYDSGTYEIHLRDENRNDLEVFLYDYSGKKLTGRGASEKFVEHWFDDDNHDGRWGDAVYDHFNTPDNKADDASFVYPQQNNSSQPDPPPGHEDFEFLDNNDYVSKPPNPVAERIADDRQAFESYLAANVLDAVFTGDDLSDDERAVLERARRQGYRETADTPSEPFNAVLERLGVDTFEHDGDRFSRALSYRYDGTHYGATYTVE